MFLHMWLKKTILYKCKSVKKKKLSSRQDTLGPSSDPRAPYLSGHGLPVPSGHNAAGRVHAERTTVPAADTIFQEHAKGWWRGRGGSG